MAGKREKDGRRDREREGKRREDGKKTRERREREGKKYPLLFYFAF